MVFWNDNEWQIWQKIVSGSAIKLHFGKLAKEISDPEDWQWISDKLALGLLALVPTIQPDTIIFGGSVGRYFSNFGASLSKTLDKLLPKYIKRPNLIGAKNPDEAVIYGCYFYATHQQNR